VRVTDEGFLDELRVFLGDDRVDARESEFRFSADVGVDKTMPGGKVVRGKSRLYVGGLKIYEGTERDEMAGRIISGVRDLATQHSNEFVRIRAGGVVVRDRAVLLPSPAEPHLPALVAATLHLGAGYLGDELVNIDPVLRRAHGTSLPLLLDSDDVGLFPELGRTPARRRLSLVRQRDDLGARTPRRPVRADEFSASRSEPLEVGRVVFPSFEPGRATELQEIAKAEAVFRFTQAMMNLHVWGDRAFIVMHDLVTQRPTARLVVGSIPEAAELLWRTTSQDPEGR
jgi:hypothetical protein